MIFDFNMLLAISCR